MNLTNGIFKYNNRTFSRKTKPIYPNMSITEDKKYITWKTANEDIAKQSCKDMR